jgi:hypothetical protein
MSEERRQILEMLAQGKITAIEAEKLLDAIEEPSAKPAGMDTSPTVKSRPKCLRLLVEDGDEHVDIRVPLQLFRAGIKLGGLIPKGAMTKVNDALEEKGVNFNLADFKLEDIEDLIDAFGDLKMEVNGGDEKVRIFCE